MKSLRQITAMLLVVYSFSSCYSTKIIPISETMNSWIGKTEQDVRLNMGIPDNVASDGSNGQILHYESSTAVTTGLTRFIYNNKVTNYSTNIEKSYADFFINAQGTVYSWRTNYPDQEQKTYKRGATICAVTFLVAGTIGLLLLSSAGSN